MDELKNDVHNLLNMSENIKNFEETEEFLEKWTQVTDIISSHKYPRPFQKDIWVIISRINSKNQPKFVSQYRLKIIG